MTSEPSRIEQSSASEKPLTRRALREQRERSISTPPSSLVNRETGFLGLGSYSAVIDEIVPLETGVVPALMESRRAALARSGSQPSQSPSPAAAPATRATPASSTPTAPAARVRPQFVMPQDAVMREAPVSPAAESVDAAAPVESEPVRARRVAAPAETVTPDAVPEECAVRRRSSFIAADPGADVPLVAPLVPDSADDSASHPPLRRSGRSDDRQELRRRERSERERRFAWEFRENSVSRPVAGEGPALESAAAGEAFRKPPISKRSIAKRAFAGTAMVFALGIAVATTLPANAYFALSGTTSESVVTAGSARVGAQQLTTGEASISGVVRDGYESSTRSSSSLAGIKTALTFVNNPASPIQWPFPVGVPISDGFGYRDSPGGIGSTNHQGVDFAPGGGTPIGVIADGVVSKTNYSDNGGLGVYVEVEHVIDGQRITSVYGHMKSGTIAVKVGQSVKVGETLGLVGNTGTSTGNHLHLEIHVEGKAVDPFAWLKQHVKA